MANNTEDDLESLKSALQQAQNSLDDWERRDAHREGGSMAQDRRHDDYGASLRNKVYALTRQIETLERK